MTNARLQPAEGSGKITWCRQPVSSTWGKVPGSPLPDILNNAEPRRILSLGPRIAEQLFRLDIDKDISDPSAPCKRQARNPKRQNCMQKFRSVRVDSEICKDKMLGFLHYWIQEWLRRVHFQSILHSALSPPHQRRLGNLTGWDGQTGQPAQTLLCVILWWWPWHSSQAALVIRTPRWTDPGQRARRVTALNPRAIEWQLRAVTPWWARFQSLPVIRRSPGPRAGRRPNPAEEDSLAAGLGGSKLESPAQSHRDRPTARKYSYRWLAGERSRASGYSLVRPLCNSNFKPISRGIYGILCLAM